MISRRHFIVSSAGAAALASVPLAARTAPSGLIVVDPSILASRPPAGAMTMTGHALLQAILPQIDTLSGLDGVVREADALLLAELVRFHPSLRWHAVRLPRGATTAFGSLRQAALQVRVNHS